MKASTDKIKVIESIDGRVGGYYFLPTLIASRSRRKQRPLYLAHPMGITESPFFDRAGSEGCIKGWSPRMLQAWHHKPIDSTRVETGQPSFRGRVRCQSHLVAWERRRREPGSNSVSDTASLNQVRGSGPTSWRRTTHAEDFCWLSGNPPHLGPVTGAYRVPV